MNGLCFPHRLSIQRTLGTCECLGVFALSPQYFCDVAGAATSSSHARHVLVMTLVSSLHTSLRRNTRSLIFCKKSQQITTVRYTSLHLVTSRRNVGRTIVTWSTQPRHMSCVLRLWRASVDVCRNFRCPTDMLRHCVTTSSDVVSRSLLAPNFQFWGLFSTDRRPQTGFCGEPTDFLPTSAYLCRVVATSPRNMVCTWSQHNKSPMST